MRRSQIAAVIVLLVVIPTMVIRDPSPWISVMQGIALIACGIIAALPYWRESKKALAISLGVAGCVAGLAVALLLR